MDLDVKMNTWGLLLRDTPPQLHLSWPTKFVFCAKSLITALLLATDLVGKWAKLYCNRN